MNHTGKRRLIALLVLEWLFLALAGCARTSVALDPVRPDAVVGVKAVVPVALVSARPRPVPGPAESLHVAVQAPAPAPAPASGERFAFPADKGGQTLGQVLRPSDHLATPLEDLPPGPRTLPVPPVVGQPGVPLTPNPSSVLRPPTPKTAVVRPRMMGEGAPLTTYRDDPVIPAQRELDAGARIALPPQDVNQPVPLGYLGLPVPDRIPVDDATLDASVQAALSATPPQRGVNVPFTPANLPDPFQNAQTVKLRTPPPEEATPPATTTPSRPPPAPTPPPAK